MEGYNTNNYPFQDHDRCLSKTLFEIHRNTIVNLSDYDYLKNDDIQPSTYEITIKIALCLISMTASLFGNVMVIHSILIKPCYKREEEYVFVMDRTSSGSVKSIRNKVVLPKKDSVYSARKGLKFSSNSISLNSTNNFSTIVSSFKNSTNNKRESNFNRLISRKKQINVNRVYRQSKKKPVNIFVLALCFFDLMIVMWCSWVHMVNSISSNWKMGEFFCRFNTYVQVMCVVASISTLSVISIDRFRGIVLTMKKKLNRKYSIIIILLILLFSAIAALPIFIYRKQYKRIWKNHVEIWCADEWPREYIYKEKTNCVVKVDEPLRRIYYTFISIVLFFLPVLIMICCYGLIIKKISQDKLSSLSENSIHKDMMNKRRHRVNMLLIGLLISFTLCWSPAQMFILFEAYKKLSTNEMPSWFNWLYFLVFLLAYSSSAINPFIYTGLNKIYKNEFKKLMNKISKRSKLEII